MVTLADVQTARQSIAGRVHRTPLFSSRTLGERCGVRLYLKAECLQKTGSFKVRGVFHRIGRLSAQEKARGLITISAGNHAQAVAFAAAAEGVEATVVMPAGASPAKVAACRAHGARVVLHGQVLEAFARMEELRQEHGYTLIHPFADPDVLAGQGTVGLEVLEDLPDAAAVVVPVGGGGLLGGIAAAVKALRPATRIYGVEPEGAAGLSAALAAGRVVPLERVETIADGLAAPMTSDLALQQVQAFVDEVVTVTDDEIRAALTAILERAKLVAEPAGAAGLAALLTDRIHIPSGAPVAVIVSGGNIDLHLLKGLLP